MELNMGEQRLHSALAPIDVLTRLDLEQAQRKNLDEFFHEKFIGVSYQEYNTNGQGASQVSIPGPDGGYTWSLKLVSVVLSAAGNLAIFLGDNITSAPVGGGASITMGGLNVVTSTFSSNVVLVQDQRPITLLAVTGTIQQVKVIAKQVPSEMVGKL
jgi:hypothetical protein